MTELLDRWPLRWARALVLAMVAVALQADDAVWRHLARRSIARADRSRLPLLAGLVVFVFMFCGVLGMVVGLLAIAVLRIVPWACVP